MFQTTADKNCYAMTGSGENFYGFICHQHTPWYVNVLQIFTPIAVKTDTCHSYVSVLKTFTPTALNTRPHTTMHQCTLDIHTHCCQNWLTIQQSAPDIHTFCCPHTHTPFNHNMPMCTKYPPLSKQKHIMCQHTVSTHTPWYAKLLPTHPLQSYINMLQIFTPVLLTKSPSEWSHSNHDHAYNKHISIHMCSLQTACPTLTLQYSHYQHAHK